MFCHLDQGVLIFRVGLRHRASWDRNPRDTGAAVSLYPKRWSDQTGLWTMVCRKLKRHKRLQWLRHIEAEMVIGI